jgi:hypothetical protein
VRLEQDKVPCGVLCSKGFPQWLWIVDSLGFQPVWCLLSHKADLEWLRPAYPKLVCTTDLQYCCHVPAAFSDDRPWGLLAETWKELELMFFLRRGTRHIKGWNYTSECLSHVGVGGCSDAEQHVHVMARTGTQYSRRPLPGVIPSCVYTVASDTIDSGKVAQAPSVRRLPKSVVTKVGKSIHHGGGLYPFRVREHPIFLLPTVWTHTRWCRRRLTFQEKPGEFMMCLTGLLSYYRLERKQLPGWTVGGCCQDVVWNGEFSNYCQG